MHPDRKMIIINNTGWEHKIVMYFISYIKVVRINGTNYDFTVISLKWNLQFLWYDIDLEFISHKNV